MRQKKIHSVGLKALLCAFIFLLGASLSSFYYQKKMRAQCLIEGYPKLGHKGFYSFYDSKSKIPLWTYEHLTPKSLEKKVDRKGIAFFENSKLYSLHRSQLTDYYRSGYDRGHMAASANQSTEAQTLKETFLLSNVCPQHSDFNRGIWLKLESQVRAWTYQYGACDVITGPLFIPSQEQGKKVMKYEVLGENEVAVPTHFFKIIRVENQKESWIKAYCLPNQSLNKEIPLENYLVSIEEIERLSGFYFKSLHSRSKEKYPSYVDSF